MPDPRKMIGLSVVLVVLLLPIAFFSDAPAWRHADAGMAQIKISFVHGGAHKTACRRRSAAELRALPANMRKPDDCPRERVALAFVFELDGKPALKATLAPTGLSGDGPSRFYTTVPVPAGRHEFMIKLRDTRRAEGYDHVQRFSTHLAAGENLAIDFRPNAGGFVLF